MIWTFYLRDLPRPLKYLLGAFILTMLFGYSASFLILADRTSLSPDGVEENYNGNEEDETATTLKFKKSKFEVLTTVHSHVFTLGVIFLITGFLTYFTQLTLGLKVFLMIEPLISLIVSFSSLILMWRGILFFKYIAYISGGLMHSIFLLTLILILREIFKKSILTEGRSRKTQDGVASVE